MKIKGLKKVCGMSRNLGIWYRLNIYYNEKKCEVFGEIKGFTENTNYQKGKGIVLVGEVKEYVSMSKIHDMVLETIRDYNKVLNFLNNVGIQEIIRIQELRYRGYKFLYRKNDNSIWVGENLRTKSTDDLIKDVLSMEYEVIIVDPKGDRLKFKKNKI